MARQVLDNGIVLPSEYSDDWYDDMTSNLTKLDEVIGSDAEKLSASDVGAAAISNDYDDLDDKPAYNILRRASVTLTAGGTGNYSDLDSDSKIKAGDYVLDAANKLYSITAIDAANSTYTVSAAAIINITDKSELGAAALSNDYDDLDDKPAYNILRRASVTLTAGGTGNYSDLDSDSKIKAGDYVLDAANKLYSITAIDAANSTYTVSAAALFTVTDKAELGAAALSNDYDDLNNLPGYGILRFCSTAITDNSNVSFANISSVSKIAAGDFLLDTAGKLYQIASVDTANETAAVTTPVTQLALDAFVVHVSGNETIAGIKTFSDIPIFATFDGIRFRCAHNSSAYVTFRNANQANPGSIIFSANDGNVGTAFHLVDKTLIPYTNCDIDLGTSLRKWKSFNGINPGALSLPDLNNGLDISGYITIDTVSSYTPSVDGFISICMSGSASNGIYIEQGNFSSSGRDITENNIRYSRCFLPVTKNQTVNILCKSGTNIEYAKFYPNLGNV